MNNEEKVLKVQRTRFGNIWGLDSTHTYPKDILLEIISKELTETTTYNETEVQVTFSMKFLAKELLKADYKYYT